jgi:mannose-6-phosphate isomerase-like protein (cupin superfamily)
MSDIELAAVIPVEQLRDGNTFTGADYGDVPVSFILDGSEPGGGPALHRHTYDEVWIVQEGHASFTAGDRTLAAGPGTVVVVRAGTPHRFTNTGTIPMRMVCIHTSARMRTEWL